MSARTKNFYLALALTIIFSLVLAINDAPRWAILGFGSVLWVLLMILNEVER